jgi:HNH endonuclease
LFNNYKIIDDIAKFYIERKNGEIHECIVDKEDIEKLIQFDRKWFIGYTANKKMANVRCSKSKSNNKEILLHRFIVDCYDENFVVDHIDRDILNNKKENLRICTKAENSQNISNIRNTVSGIRGVTFVKHKNLWRGRVTLNGKTHYLGMSKNKEEIERRVIEFRRENLIFSEDDKYN